MTRVQFPTMLRLNKYLAHAGVGSRRHCDDLIAAGRVKIDGEIVRDLGTRSRPGHAQVAVDDQPVAGREARLLAGEQAARLPVHQPRPRRPAAGHRPGAARRQRVYTVGRLDEDSEGLLLLTNDGDLAQQLMHPRFGVEKTYHVLVAGSPTPDDLQQLLNGVWLSDGHVKAKFVKRLKRQGDSTWLQIVLTEGKNREIRRMLAKLDHKVMRLQRVAIGPVRLDRLPKGKSRKLALRGDRGLAQGRWQAVGRHD